jgi:hypothetical protein
MENDKEHTDGHTRRSHSDNAALVGPIWFIGWLFTIALAQLPWWKIIIGLVIWPYFLGAALR